MSWQNFCENENVHTAHKIELFNWYLNSSKNGPPNTDKTSSNILK